MSGVPYTFGTATTSIPLSNLDSNFVTPVTIGNASVALGNTISTIGNLTLNNVTINGGTINASVTESYTLANAVVYSNSSNVGVTSANLTFDGTNLATTGTATATRFIPSGSTVATNGMFLPSANTLGFSTASTEAMRIDSSGNVLVGKTTSAYSVSGRGVIEIGGSSESLLGFTIGSGLTNSSYLYNNSTNFEFNVTGSRYLFWTINGSERMRIDSSGNLLVACTGLPTGGVGGISLSSPATSNGMLLGTTGTGATNMIRFYNPNGNVGAITTSGSLTTYAVSSDYRLKENLASLENAKEFILSLKPKQGNWKADGSKFVGFVAHEFAQTSPTSVIGEKDAVDEEGKPVYQSMQASSAEVMANLISLVQEQQALIESLTTRLTALESK